MYLKLYFPRNGRKEVLTDKNDQEIFLVVSYEVSWQTHQSGVYDVIVGAMLSQRTRKVNVPYYIVLYSMTFVWHNILANFPLCIHTYATFGIISTFFILLLTLFSGTSITLELPNITNALFYSLTIFSITWHFSRIKSWLYPSSS